MGGWDEEVWYSLLEVARLSERLGASLADIRSAYLDAFQCRPARAEPLVELARLHRERGEWNLAWLFAGRAREIPRPPDLLFLDEAAYAWRADDEAAVAAYWTGRRLESWNLNRELLDGDRLPEEERARVEGNCEHSLPDVQAASGRYPVDIVERLSRAARPRPGPGVTLTVTTCKRLALFELSMNSFLNCCRDIDCIDRFVCIDDNSSDGDRARMRERYPFLEFILKGPEERGHALSMNRLLDTVATPWWLHLEDDWHFADRIDYVARALAIFDVEPSVAQVVFNRNYAELLASRTIVGGILRRHPESRRRYVLHEHVPDEAGQEAFFSRYPAGSVSNAWWPHFSLQPSMMRTAAIRAVGRFDEGPGHFELDYARRFTAAGKRTAFLDAVVCTHIGRLNAERGGPRPNAYELNQVRQF